MNTFSNIFKKSFLEGFGGSDITTVRILVTLAVTCALALYIFIVYYVATKKKQGEYTIEDYRKLPEDERAELIDGTIYDMAAPLSVHQLLASKIYSSLAGYIEKNQDACIPMFAPVDVQLDQDDKTMVQPDLMIVCDRKKLTRQGVFGAPDFIIEILSESTRKKDSYLKLMKY